MKRVLLGLLMLFPSGLLAQYGAISNYCIQGGTQASVQGLLSTNYQQGIVPGCTVTVFLTGTTSPATIYSTSSGGSLGNPFTANQTTGQWLFYASSGQSYDCVLSGGTGSNVFTTPVTITGCFGSGGGGSGGLTPIGPYYNVTQYGTDVGAGIQTTGTILATSNQLTVTGGVWAVGQAIQVAGAGAGGTVPLLTTVTTINGNILTLSATATTSVSGGAVYSDDTAAINSAFLACFNGGGGTVQFPGGNLNYQWSYPIYAFHNCRIQGNAGTSKPSFLTWIGTTQYGASIPFSSWVVATNSTFFGPSSPTELQTKSITITATNTLAVGNWVFISGCTSVQGMQINNDIAEVAAANGSSFTVVVPFVPTNGSFTDANCNATSTTVGLAFDAQAHFEQEIKDVQFFGLPSARLTSGATWPASEQAGAMVYFGSRIDTGTRIYNSYIDGGKYFNLYFSNGGINVDFDKGWRSDGSGGPSSVALVYWRVGSLDHFRMATGEISSNDWNSGAYLMVDNQGCANNGGTTVQMDIDHMTFEIDQPLNLGMGAITTLACATQQSPQFYLNLNTVNISCAFPLSTTPYFSCPSLSLQNQTDAAIGNIKITNSFLNGTFLGLPGFTRGNVTGVVGNYPDFDYTLTWQSAQNGAASTGIPQALSDFNFDNLYQDGIQASAFLYSDTAFAALSNESGATLYEGQILAPPAYWSVSTSTRYALDVVTASGTVGSPGTGINCVSSGTDAFSCVGPSATITATSCSGNVLTVTASNSFASGNQLLLYGTGEPLLNGYNGGYLTVSATGLSGSQFEAPFFCNGFTGNIADTGTAVLNATENLALNQFITVGAVHTRITSLNAAINTSVPGTIAMNVANNTTGIVSPTALAFTAPTLGSEIQLLTKFAAAPTTGTWSVGDYVENSGATANGIAGWVNVTAGTPGTWVGVPAGNTSGKVVPSQLTNTVTTINSTPCTLGGANCIVGSAPVVFNGLIEQCFASISYVSFGCNFVSAASSTASIINATATSPVMGSQASTTSGAAGWSNYTGGAYPYYSGRAPNVTYGIAYSGTSDYTTTARIQIGLIGSSCSVATMTAGDTPSCSYAIIRSSTSASDANYECVSDNGSGTPQVQAIGTAVPQVLYQQMSISIAPSTGAVTCTIGANTVTNSATVPAGNITMYDLIYNTGLASGVVHIRSNALYAFAQNGSY